jgi:hypothetical protein
MIIQDTWDWKTHQPIVELMLSEFHPELILELGMGFNSTPLFIEYNPKELICIENDKDWLKTMLATFKFKENHKVIFHDTPDESRASINNHINNFNYYVELRDEIVCKEKSIKLLFVDNYACLRLLAITILGDSFDIIIHHDSQPGGSVSYSEYFKNFRETYDCYLLKTSKNWTSCLISKQLEYNQNQICEKLALIISKFCFDNGLVPGEMYLEKQ